MTKQILEEVAGKIDDLGKHAREMEYSRRRVADRLVGQIVIELTRLGAYFRRFKFSQDEELRNEAMVHFARVLNMQQDLAEYVEWDDADLGYCAHLEGEASAIIERAVSESKETITHYLNDPSVRRQVRALTDGRCSYCDCDLPDNWHIDHVVPKSAGGPDNIANYVPSCPTCNISKNGNHVLDFIKKSRGKVVQFRSEGAA